MRYESLDEIYAGNQKIRARLKELLSTLSDDQVSVRPNDENWNVAEIVEHISMVDESTVRICAKLLKKAHDAGRGASDGLTISEGFLQKAKEIAVIKVEAPTFVCPSGEKTIAESLARLDETEARLDEMKELFESTSGSDFTFPHPYFGEINAHEWLALKGGHELRHLKQIEDLLATGR